MKMSAIRADIEEKPSSSLKFHCRLKDHSSVGKAVDF